LLSAWSIGGHRPVEQQIGTPFRFGQSTWLTAAQQALWTPSSATLLLVMQNCVDEQHTVGDTPPEPTGGQILLLSQQLRTPLLCVRHVCGGLVDPLVRQQTPLQLVCRSVLQHLDCAAVLASSVRQDRPLTQQTPLQHGCPVMQHCAVVEVELALQTSVGSQQICVPACLVLLFFVAFCCVWVGVLSV
jgi:hypothetical protein